MITMIKIDNVGKRETGEFKIMKLKQLTETNFHRFEFVLCPAYGSFDLYVQSDYEFDGDDPEKELLSAFNFALMALV